MVMALTGEEFGIMAPYSLTFGMRFAALHLVDEVGLATIPTRLHTAVATAQASGSLLKSL